MGIHPSLKSSDELKKQRSVLKRSERLKMMLEKGTWKEGSSVYGLPKIKTMKIRIKKEKAAEKATDLAAAGGAVAPADTVTPKAAPAKGAAKTKEKK